ncbi:hypothetical protein L596_002864 [Steinernema carpocapsae]|uniref:Uncharacterized protein n=1 Tax=Steinernema carpocapsae TaxID=34508 RepID=A0A4U8UQT0_STECR|nr:hypothetical protein L596_002864 [Steinernema carpocapsae]
MYVIKKTTGKNRKITCGFEPVMWRITLEIPFVLHCHQTATVCTNCVAGPWRLQGGTGIVCTYPDGGAEPSSMATQIKGDG